MNKQAYRDPRDTRQSRPAETTARTCRCPTCGREECDRDRDPHGDEMHRAYSDLWFILRVAVAVLVIVLSVGGFAFLWVLMS